MDQNYFHCSVASSHLSLCEKCDGVQECNYWTWAEPGDMRGLDYKAAEPDKIMRRLRTNVGGRGQGGKRQVGRGLGDLGGRSGWRRAGSMRKHVKL